MGYKQISGTAQLLVNEHGQVRDGLRNLPEDSDRFIYSLDEEGNKKNEWPLLLITLSGDGEDEKTLLPEVVLKTHGVIPDKVKCSAGDFKSKSGSKSSPYDSAVENVEYKGDASADAKPYKDSPDKKEEEKGKSEPKGDDSKNAPKPPQPVDKKVDTELPEPKSSADTPEKKVAEKTSKKEEEPSDLQKGSAELTAKRAIEIIETYELEELEDFDFFTEGTGDHKERVTVVEAWNKKKEG